MLPIDSTDPALESDLQARRFPHWVWAAGVLLLASMYLAFEHAVRAMVQQWSLEEFSHGYLIPFISLYLAWQRRSALRWQEFRGSWAGVAAVGGGILLGVAGRLATLVIVEYLALIVVIAGLVLALTGWRALRTLRVPLAILLFMIPLPNIVMNALSAQLQLMSSALGVWILRLVGVTVFLEGNVIDLGTYRLEVAEACSGLRYLLPLMTLSFLIACLYRAALWKRVLIFVSSIPVTLVTNSIRIATIGVMVDTWGPQMAEGAVHAVQGWMMFMVSTAVVLLEVIALSHVGGDRVPWRTSFGLEGPALRPFIRPVQLRTVPVTAWSAAGLVLMFALSARALPVPQEWVPNREKFASFPLHVGRWSGRQEPMEQVYLDALKLDDYLLTNYVAGDSVPVNLYVAWYDRQSTGDSTHSPKACLPGGGWRIDNLRQIDIAPVKINGQVLRVNRALIQYDTQRQLVYYWFQQRGRVVTSEYLVKWYLLVDSVREHRTDGALVRLMVPIGADMSEGEADRTLRRFIAEVSPRMEPYLPG